MSSSYYCTIIKTGYPLLEAFNVFLQISVTHAFIPLNFIKK